MRALASLAALAAAILLAGCGGGTAEADADTGPDAATLAARPSSKVWVLCATEGGTCSFEGKREVRYGTAANSVTRKLRDGTACANEVFGDPDFGVTKRCWVRVSAARTAPVSPPPPASAASGAALQPTANWTYCSAEGRHCHFSGTRQVRFGTLARNVTRTATESVACSAELFGDPAAGLPKSCWVNALH